MSSTIGQKRYQILKEAECCEVEGKEFDDIQLAVGFMRSAPYSTYLLDRVKNEIVATYEKQA